MGRALDLASGTGGNAIWLAQHGWNVTAVDISPVGLQIGRMNANRLPIEWRCADLDEYTPPERFSLIVCFRFLDRRHLPAIVEACLEPGGHFVAETFNVNHLRDANVRISNPDFLLEVGEWGRLFPGMEILELDESGSTSRLLARR